MQPIVVSAIGIIFQLALALTFILFSVRPAGATFNMTEFLFTSMLLFIGFPLFYSFLKRYSWTSIGHSFLLTIFSIESYLLFHDFWYYVLNDSIALSRFSISFNSESVLSSNICAVAVLITFGVLVGKLSLFQIFLLSLLESFFYSLNEAILEHQLSTIDTGRGLSGHVFACLFGLLVSLVSSPADARNHPLQNRSYSSTIYSMAGALFLFLSWPCLNSSLILHSQDRQYFSIINTVLALIGSTAGAFFTSFSANIGKLNLPASMSAALSGGVAIAIVSADLESPGYALILGVCTGVVSLLGFEKLNYRVDKALRLHDTAGVLSLHGIPGIIGWGFSVGYFVVAGQYSQGLAQVYGLLWTVIIAAIAGVLCGFALKATRSKTLSEYYLDEEHWTKCESGENGDRLDPLINYPSGPYDEN